MESLESRRLLAVVAYDESISGDLDASTAAPAFVLDSAGTNTWIGELTTPTDLSDGFQVTLDSGIGVTDIRLSYQDIDSGTFPDTGMRASGAGVFDHSFAGTESVSAGAFSTANPNLPIHNDTYLSQVLAEILVEASDAAPSAIWQIEIDTTVVPLPPSITTPTAISVDENESNVIDINSVDDVDTEGTGLIYMITGGTDASAFGINPSTGELQFTSPPNYESPTDIDTDNLYEVSVTVFDSDSLVDSADLLVSVLDVNEAPVADAGGPYTIDAGLALALDASGTVDPDLGDILTYDWDLDGDGTADLTSNSATVSVPWLTMIDLIGVGAHTIDLVVTDSGGLISTDSADLTIRDHFVYPAVSDGSDDSYTIAVSGLDLQVTETGSNTLLSWVPLQSIASIEVQGGADVDTLTLDFSGGNITAPITYDGGAPTTSPGDALVLANSTVQTVIHTFNDASSGSIDIQFDALASGTIQYTGLEPITDNLSAVDRTFMFKGGVETVTMSNADLVDNDINRIDSDLGELVDYLNPSDSVTVFVGTGPNVLNLDSYDSSNPLLDVRLTGGVNTDTFNIGSPGEGLRLIDVPITIDGGLHDADPPIASNVTAKLNSIDVSLVPGDTVNFIDDAIATDETYSLSDTTLTSTTLPAAVTYSGIETVTLATGTGNDTVSIASTNDSSSVSIQTGNGNDTITVLSTGISSHTEIDSADGEDTVSITTSGVSSIIQVDTGNDNDDVDILNSGETSGIEIDTGLVDTGIVVAPVKADVVTIAATGMGSATVVFTGDGSDVINLRSTGITSSTDLFSGEGADTINLASDAAGDRSLDRSVMRGPLSGTLDGLRGEICVDAGSPANSAGTVESVTAKMGRPDEVSVVVSVATNDELNLIDAGNLVSKDYTLDATTFTRTDIPVSVIYSDVETLHLETGVDADFVAIASTSDATRTTVDTGDGNDTMAISTTGMASQLIVQTGAGEDVVSVVSTGSASVTKIDSGNDNDDVFVASTGADSGLSIDTGLVDTGVVSGALKADVVDIITTGTSSATSISTGDGTDVINVRGTGAASATDLFAGSGIDTVNLSSDAAGTRSVDRDVMRGNPSGNLDALLGSICVFGEAPGPAAGIAETITAKPGLAGEVSVTVDLALGDELNISDETQVAAKAYLLSDTTLTRSDIPITIDFDSIETLNLETGSEDDSVSVSTTADSTRTTIHTGSGNDAVSISTTGTSSFLAVETGDGEDSVIVDSTGADSVTNISTGNDNDEVDIQSTGDGSGIQIDTGMVDTGLVSGILRGDLISIATTGADSATVVMSGDGTDVVNVRATATGSATDLFAGSGADTINLSSDAMGALSVDRLVMSGTLAGNLDGFLGDVRVFGEAPSPSGAFPESIVAKSGTPDEVSVTLGIDQGDELNLSDRETATDKDYTLTPSTFARADLASTVTYETIETLNLETGSAVDTVAVMDTTVSVRTSLTTGAGNDVVAITRTGDSSIFVLETQAGEDNVTVTNTGESSLSRILTGDDNDDVLVESTGDSSGIQIETGIIDSGIVSGAPRADLVTIMATGASSATIVETGDGSDIINVQSTAAASATDLRAGVGNDTINLTSTANGDRMSPSGDPMGGDLAGFLGAICVFGEDQDALTTSDSISGRRTIGTDVTVSAAPTVGDQLNISDRLSLLDTDYTISASSIDSTQGFSIVYDSIETLDIQTSRGSNTIDVLSSNASASLGIESQSGEDTVNIFKTGPESITSIDTGDDIAAVNVVSTGDRSLTSISTGSSADLLTIQSLGDESGVEGFTGTGEDTITITTELAAPDRTGAAVIAIDAGADNDEFLISEIFLNTVVDLSGGAGSDQFEITASGNDLEGYLIPLNNDPMGSDVVAATRQLFIDGGSHGGETTAVTQGVSVLPNFQAMEHSIPAVETGDQIILDASLSTNPLDLRYVITGPAQGVLATTPPVVPGTPRHTVGNEVLETFGVETLEVIAGSGDDLITVSSEIAFDIESSKQLLRFNGGGGTDKIEIVGTDELDDLITVGEQGDADVHPIDITQFEFLRIDGRGGNDQISAQTNTTSSLNGGLGDDIVLGGPGSDFLTGGPGIDSLFGGDGNDLLLTDQDINNPLLFIESGEIINGGDQVDFMPGDVCFQFDVDEILNCEVLGDGGGRKDVLTWFQAIFVTNVPFDFDGADSYLPPFEPVLQDPVAELSVTEPSQIPSVAPLPLTRPAVAPPDTRPEIPTDSSRTDPEPVFHPTDVDQNGLVTPVDALLILNHLHAQQSSDSLGEQTHATIDSTRDVNGNGTVEPRDALMVINYLARSGAQTIPRPAQMETIVAAEGEAVVGWGSAVDSVFAESDDDDDHLLQEIPPALA